MESVGNPNVTSSNSYTVLIVDTVAINRERYQQYLHLDSSCKYIVLEADSAQAAIKVCQQQQVDGVLVNESLSDATGLQLFQTLQQQLNGATPPIVMVAAAADPTIPIEVAIQQAVNVMKLGLADYLWQPTLSSEQLQGSMKQAIENARSHLQPRQHDEQAHIQQLDRDLADRVNELQTLIELAPVGIAIASDPDCVQMHCNAYLREWLGVSPHGNISKSAPAEEQPAFQVLQNGQEVAPEDLPMQVAARLGIDVRETEIEIRLPDGTSRQLLSYATPLRGEQNEIRGVVGAFLDITERKRVEVELQEREATIRRQFAELESIYATAPVGLCFQDADLRYVRINDRLAKINGVPAADHLGRTTHEVLPELADTVEPLHRHVIETGEPILDIEIHGVTKAQPAIEYSWIASYYPLKDPEGQVLGVNVVVQDITELKQVQLEREQLLRQLAVEHSFLEQTLQQMPSGVAIAEAPSGKLLFHNDEAIRLIRHPMNEAETFGGYAKYGALHPDGRPYQSEEYPIARSVLWGEVIKAAEMRYRRGDGTETIFSVNSAPIVDQSGNRIAAISTFEDISQRKQIEAERAELLAQAEIANRSKDEFVAMVAHELRSPLNAISGWAKLLQTRQFDPQATNKALETIVRNTQAQAQLVEDLLDVSRMVRGTLQLTMTSVNLKQVIETALETIRPIAEAKQLSLESQINQVAPILGDFNRLQQVVLNLLTNAIKFTPEGGRIEVSLSLIQPDPKSNGSGQTINLNHYAQITVRDAGKGIAPDFLPYIFERFRQDQHNTTTKQGLGLGLTIVKHLVEMHQGTVQATSPGEGQGATFTVCLPMLQDPGKLPRGRARVPQAPTSPIPLQDVRVLLVDDEPDMLDLAAFILRESGAIIEVATNVTSALERLSDFQPDLVLTDIAMPGQDGYELLRQMRSRHPEGQIPAIALTAYASQACREKSLQLGFQQHLTKPVEPEQLIAAIVSAIGLRRS